MLRHISRAVLSNVHAPREGHVAWAPVVQAVTHSEVSGPFRRWISATSCKLNDADQKDVKEQPQETPSEAASNSSDEDAVLSIVQLQAELEVRTELLEATQAELAKIKDAALRVSADMANLRTRTANQIDEARQFALQGFSKELLDVADNLDRALGSVPASVLEAAAAAPEDEIAKNLVSLHAGVGLSQKIMLKVFKQNGLEAVSCDVGSSFDPNVHNAMFEVPTADVEAGKIAAVIKQGYSLKGRVIRAADVGVARPPT